MTDYIGAGGGQPTRPRSVIYSDGQRMMAHGATALHEDIAAKVETSLGKAFPQMEIRFRDLSLTADMVLAHDRHAKNGHATAPDDELPTLPNHVLQKIAQVSTKKHTVQKHILRNLSGVFKPGTVTLILGQSGSGKSALMKILSGRFPIDKRISVGGSITYNGMARNEIVKRLPQFVAYVTQHDVHFPTLTVKETLEFAHECCGAELSPRADRFFTQGTPEENETALHAARNVIRHYPEIVTQELGLTHCLNTIVGDAMLRGVSGGERKRVTTGEMEFGMKYVTLMDEITTGLDSAAAFDIINTQRSIAKRLHKTVIISLLQPSPEVFALFDSVLLLNEGDVMYHGPRDQALAYFQSLGFVCPPQRDVADFLCDLGTQQQIQYEVGRLPPPLVQFPRDASEFAAIFRESAIFRATCEELEAPTDPVLLMDVANHITPIPEFYQGFWASTWTLIRRQTTLLLRNQAFLQGRALLVAVMGFLFSSLFYQMDFTDVQVVLGVIFAAVLFLGLGQSSMLTTFFRARAVFYKQRGANFYRTSSYVLAASVSQFPLALAEAVLFGSLVYWFGGFVGRVGAFLLFELYLLLSILVFLAWFFFLSAVAPNLHIAKPLAMVSLLVFILFAGFVVSKDQIPDYLRWIYWVDPIAWTVRGLAVSQYRSDTYDTCAYKGVAYCTPAFQNKTMGAYYLSLFDVPAERSWQYTGLVFMVGAYLLFMVLAWLVLEYKRYEQPEHIGLPKELLDQEAADALAAGDSQTDYYQTLASPSHTRANAQLVLDVGPRVSTARACHPVTIAFKDLWYTVPVPGETKGTAAQSIDLLKGITGYATPGTITALMGSSGAGKTTLMDVIAGRKTGTGGTIRGTILLNGFEASDLAIRRCTGYCEQMDIHSEAATFREALTFSAFLRQAASVSDSQKYDSVDECLELLDMHDIADHIIRGSSMEQHKRLTIGVELAAQPSVLFLDEPTSGLDARSAKVIMDGVRKVADTGRTILCTIHQPSSEVFHLFDRLLLLKRGGETAYFGPLGVQGRELIAYFEALPGVPTIADGANPATWMLEVIGAGVADGADSGGGAADFVGAYQRSATKAQALDTAMAQPGLFAPSPTAPQVSFASKRAATNAVQLQFLLHRFFTVYWRTPSYNVTRFVISLLLGVVFGLVYLDSEYTTYQGINGGLGMIFLATAFLGVVSFISILPLAFEERAAFYRERASQTYNALWYFVCFTVVEVPYVCVGALLFTAVFYPMVGFTGVGTAAFYWLNTMLHTLFQAYLGQLLIFALPSIEVAAVIGVLLNAVFFLFMGFNPPEMQIPQAYKWLYAITPQRYSFALLAGSVFGDCSDAHLAQMALAATVNATRDVPSSWELGCQLLTNAPPSIGDRVPLKMYIDGVFGIKHAHLAQYFAIFLGMIVLFRGLAAVAMRYVNHQKR